jgi:hypothetical protein
MPADIAVAIIKAIVVGGLGYFLLRTVGNVTPDDPDDD